MSEIMIKFLLLYACALTVNNKEQNQEYTYGYDAVLSVGAPEINSKVSGMKLSAALILQMKTRTRGIAKLNIMKVSSFANEICSDDNLDFQTPLNKNSPMMMYKEKFEIPFAVNLDPKADVKMLVDENEEEFITNIRKSILNMIRSDVIKKVYQQNNKDEDWHRVVQEEETLFGKCPVHYTFGPARLPLENTWSQLHQKFLHMINSTDYPNHRPTSHSMYDTYIDFDKCKDPVVLQKTSLGNLTGSSKNLFKSILSRLSTEKGLFLMDNKDKEDPILSMIMKRNGHIIINPFGYQSEKFIMKTYQTIFRGMPLPIKTPLRLPAKTKEVKTFLFEVASSYPPPRHPKSWINYNETNFNLYPISELFTTGIKATNDLYINTMNNVMNLVEKAVDSMTSHPESKSKPTLNAENDLGISYMVEATKLIKILPDEALMKLYGTVEKDNMKAELKRTLLIDAFAAAGTSQSIRILLYFIQMEKLTPTREASVWITLTNSIESPEIVGYLVDYVRSTTDSHRTVPLSSAALVSVATIVNRLCVDPKRTEYSVQKDLYGARTCNRNDVLKNLLEYLQSTIMVNLDPMREPYFVQALSNLASPNDTLSIFEDIIHKKIRPATEDRIRTLAVYALEKNKMGEEMKERVFITLMSLFYDETESEEMRQSAFITMLTWEPESAWWQRMAKHTWTESSTNVASFIYFTIKSLSEASSMELKKQSTIASFVLPLAKPLPASYSKSFNFIFAKYLHRENIDTRFHFEWLSNPASFIPRQAYSHLSTSFGGIDFNLFEVALSVYNLDSEAIKNLTFEKYTNEEFSSFPNLNPELSEGINNFIKQKLNNRKASKSEPVANLLLRAFDNIYAFLPLRIKDLNPFNKESQEKLKIENHYTKFFSPESSQMVIPTDVGLPLILEVSSSVLGYVDHANIEKSGSDCEFKNCLRLEYDLRLSTKLTSSIKTFLPWSNETILVAVDNSKKLLLPLSITLTTQKMDNDTNVSFRIGSLHQSRFPMIMASNEPYTAIKSILPGREAQTVSHNTIHVGNSSLQNETHDLSSHASNLNFTLKYEGDVNLPFSSANFIDLIRKPENVLTWLSSPTLKKWGFSLDFDPTISRTKNVRFMFHAGNSNPIFLEDINSKVSSEQNNSETALKSFNGFRKFITKGISKTEQFLEFYVELCGHNCYYINSNVYGVYLSYNTKQMDNYKRNISSRLTFYSIQVHGTGRDFVRHSIESEIELPDVTNYDSLLHAVQSGMEIKYGGNAVSFQEYVLPDSKNTSLLFSFMGSLKVSKELQERLLEDLNKDCLRNDHTFMKDLNSVLTYDETSLSLTYKLNNFERNLLNLTYALNDWFKGIYFPHYISNRLDVKNEEELVEVFAKRMVHEEDYDIFIKRPEEQISIKGFKFPFGVNKLFSYEELTTISLGGNLTYCDIELKSIKTFDGLQINFPINFCPLGITIKNPFGPLYLFMAQLYNYSKPELVLFYHPFETKISDKEITVNKKVIPEKEGITEIKDEFGRVFLKIKSEKYRTVEFVSYFTIEIHEKSFRIYPDPGRKGLFMGMCGNYNDNPIDDAQDCENCSYESSKYLGAAWTIRMNTLECNGEGWLQKLVEDYPAHRRCPP